METFIFKARLGCYDVHDGLLQEAWAARYRARENVRLEMRCPVLYVGTWRSVCVLRSDCYLQIHIYSHNASR